MLWLEPGIDKEDCVEVEEVPKEDELDDMDVDVLVVNIPRSLC
jgi:hypothetical protein